MSLMSPFFRSRMLDMDMDMWMMRHHPRLFSSSFFHHSPFFFHDPFFFDPCWWDMDFEMERMKMMSRFPDFPPIEPAPLDGGHKVKVEYSSSSSSSKIQNSGGNSSGSGSGSNFNNNGNGNNVKVTTSSNVNSSSTNNNASGTAAGCSGSGSRITELPVQRSFGSGCGGFNSRFGSGFGDFDMKPFDFGSSRFDSSLKDDDAFPKLAEDGKSISLTCTLPDTVDDPSKVDVSCNNQEIVVKVENKVESPEKSSKFSYYKRTTMPANTNFDSLKCSLEGTKLIITANTK